MNNNFVFFLGQSNFQPPESAGIGNREEVKRSFPLPFAW